MGVFLFILKELKEFIGRGGDWRRVWHLTHWSTEGGSGEHAGDFRGARGRVYGLEKNELRSFTTASGRTNEVWD